MRQSMRPADHTEHRAPSSPEPAGSTGSGAFNAVRKCRTVVYVDDDPDICIVVQTTLCLLAGMDVHTACSGEMAIGLAYEKRPDLIVLDVMMPGLDGPATYRRIRESPLIADTPIVFMTAKVMPAEVAHFLGLGAIGVIGKPFDPLRIGDELHDLWNKARTMPGFADRRGGQAAVLVHVDALANSFLERTRGDVDRLRYLVKGVRAESRNELTEIERIAHSIHGAGAMFGFPDVSTLGDAIERLAEALLMGPELGAESAEGAELRLEQLTEQIADALATADATAPGRSGTAFESSSGEK